MMRSTCHPNQPDFVTPMKGKGLPKIQLPGFPREIKTVNPFGDPLTCAAQCATIVLRDELTGRPLLGLPREVRLMQNTVQNLRVYPAAPAFSA